MYDTTLDPCSPDFDPRSWGTQDQPLLLVKRERTEAQKRVREELAKGKAAFAAREAALKAAREERWRA